MAFENIDTIFFDVGATLRYVVEDREFAADAERRLMEIVGAEEPHDLFFEKLEANWKAYRKLAKSRLLDVSEMELWLQYLLPDYPAERVAPHAAKLTRLWRDHDGRRVVHEGTLETLRTLKKGGAFAIHDIFSQSKYGDMQAFVRQLKDMGYRKAELIDTTDGKFMTKFEAAWMGLGGSALLTGIK